MEKYIYKIRHIKTGKFLKTKLTLEGIKVWDKKNILGNLPINEHFLHNNATGWSTPPEPSNKDFALIGCEVVKYKVTIQEVK